MTKAMKKIYAWLLTVAMVFGMMHGGASPFGVVEKAQAADVTDDGWTVSWNGDDTTVAEGTKYGNYTAVLNGSTMSIGSSSKSLNGKSFTHCLKLGGSGSNSKRNLTFDAPTGGTLTVYAITGNSSDLTRTLVLEDPDGKPKSSKELPNELTECTWTLDKGGTYYLYSANSGINLYYVSFEKSSDDTPLTGKVPTASAVTVNLNDTKDKIEVSWEGSKCEGDGKYEVAVSKDKAGFEKISGSATTEFAYTYTPTASGTYQFQVYGVLGTEKSEPVVSEDIVFTYPLAKPEVTATIGDSMVKLSWKEVVEAQNYQVKVYQGEKELTDKAVKTEETSVTIEGLTNKTEYTFVVTAVRDTETAASEAVAATPKGTDGEFDAVPGMRIVNQNGGLPLLITRENGDIRALENATSGGFSSTKLSNIGFLLTTETYSGDFTVTADVKVVNRATNGTSGGFFLGAFTEAEEKAQLFTVAARNDGNTRVYYTKNGTTNSATGTTETLDGTYTVKRENGVYTATYKSEDGSGSVSASSTDSSGSVPISDVLATGEVYLGFGIMGAEVEVTNLKITAGGKTIIDSATMTGSYAPEKKDWALVADPVLGTPVVSDTDPSILVVPWTMAVGLEGADSFSVTMYNEKNEEIGSQSTKTAATEGTFEFVPASSGTYTFKGTALREKETEKESNFVTYSNFILPIAKPEIVVMNAGGGKVKVTWEKVPEATSYEVSYKMENSATAVVAKEGITETEYVIPALELEKTYEIIVTAVRGTDRTASEAVAITVKDKIEREWKFAWFGTSTSETANTVNVSADKETIILNSCTYKADGVIDKKGGKFTSYFDGISYYYTEVDPEKENFVVTAKFHVDYLNPTVDGQEGFGIVVRDSIGEHGVNSSMFMTNSAAVLATKVEGTVDGTKVSLKDGLGTRFTTGLTPELVEAGATTGASSKTDAFEWNPEKIIKQGEDYVLTLKKTNTGFHAILNGDEENEIIMYDNYCKKLTAIDKEKIYVGFAVARGCNVTITDISFTTSDPATDPEAIPEPKEKIEPSYRVTSPATSGSSQYKLVFESNADGKVVITKGNKNIAEADVKAGEAFNCNTTLVKGKNRYTVTFTPVEGFETKAGEILSSYETVTKEFEVDYRDISTTTNTIYVTPDGKASGNGTKAAPLDIYTATAYAKAGQTIVLKDGTYQMTKKLKIDRGIDGTANAKIVLMSEKGGRAILDFAGCGGNFELWGSYWHIYGIDVCNTDGNVKGMQVAGHYNIIELVNTYRNGDTGLQISGVSSETKERWPSNNLILNCTSYDNCDPGHNNADGFAAKLTCGEGNIFRGCIAYNNLDDGWDLYSKVESGPIGAVTLENCLAYRNGTILDGSASGDGNGFKLGGDGIAVPHVLKNCISYENDANGVTSNSDPAILLYNNTSVGNGGTNYSLYGKGSTALTFVAENNISYKGSSIDDIKLASLYNAGNYFDGINSDGVRITDEMFVSMDTSVQPTRTEDGSIDMHGLFVLTELAPKDAGAVLKATTGSVLDYKIVSGTSSSSSSSSSSSRDDDDDDRSSYSSVNSYDGKSSLNSTEQNKVSSAAASVFGSSSSVASAAKTESGICITSKSGDVIFSKNDGSMAKNEWQKVGADWYYFDADSKAADGWKQLGGKWYYLDDNSKKMVTGWKKTATNKWYYLDPTNGDMKTGWQLINKVWYYLDQTNGDMKTGWQWINNKWYYLDQVNGDMKTGWQLIRGKWYYMDLINGDCLLNTVTPDGYTVDENGAWIP